MKRVKVSIISTIVISIGGCGGTPACQEPQPYEESRLGKHIETPEGLDALDSERELTIPEPSPRPPRSENSPCLEYPPSFQTEEPPAEEEPAEEEPAEEPPAEEEGA